MLYWDERYSIWHIRWECRAWGHTKGTMSGEWPGVGERYHLWGTGEGVEQQVTPQL